MLILDLVLSILTLGAIQPTPTIDLELIGYYNTLDAYSKTFCDAEKAPIRVIGWTGFMRKIATKEEENIGVALNYYFVPFSDIYINRPWWEESAENERMLVMAHELVHAWYEWEHVASPSLMAPDLDYSLPAKEAIGAVFAAECRKRGLDVKM